MNNYKVNFVILCIILIKCLNKIINNIIANHFIKSYNDLAKTLESYLQIPFISKQDKNKIEKEFRQIEIEINKL